MENDVRKPPIGAVLALHKQGVRGWCGWCGKPVEERTPARGWLKFWHDACAEEMAIIEQPTRARAAVFARDKGICAGCGEDWSQKFRLIPTHKEKDGTPRILWVIQKESRLGLFWSSYAYEVEGGYPLVELTAVSLWHVDHRVPLWKARHLPPLQRIEFFKLAALVTRCTPCHKIKTAKEAAEKAKFDAQAEDAKERAPRGKPKWGSRPFPKGVKKPWPKRKM